MVETTIILHEIPSYKNKPFSTLKCCFIAERSLGQIYTTFGEFTFSAIGKAWADSRLVCERCWTFLFQDFGGAETSGPISKEQFWTAIEEIYRYEWRGIVVVVVVAHFIVVVGYVVVNFDGGGNCGRVVVVVIVVVVVVVVHLVWIGIPFPHQLRVH